MHDLPRTLPGPTPRLSSRIHVCPLSAVPRLVASHQASHLVTCLKDHVLVETLVADQPRQPHAPPYR